jgi:opacity protein-like surface antigen
VRSKVLLAALVAAPLAMAAQSAGAATVTFTGNGAFSGLTGCGFSSNCSISSSGNQVNLGGVSGFLGLGGPSTLTAVDQNNISFAVPPNRNDFTVGEIDWVNRSTTGTPSDLKATYTFTLSFTSPSNQSDSQAFSLDIQQTTNPNGDVVLNLSNATLSNLGPFSLAGITVSDIHFSLASGSSGTYDGSRWTNPEDHTSRMLITADFAQATPEPASMAVLGAGLVGVGLARRRKSAKSAS